MKTLHLTLKKKWFDMIASGEKTEEYREIKSYWIQRLLECNCPKESKTDNENFAVDIYYDYIVNDYPFDDKLMKAYYASFINFDAVIFRNGYSGGAPLASFRNPVISIGEGRPEWGAEPGKKYFVIKLGDKI